MKGLVKMSFKICLAMLASLLFFQLSASAQTSESPSEPVYLKGRIYDITSFLPISTVDISVKNENGEEVIFMSTDENGNYKLVNLEKGSYTVTVNKGSEYEMTSQKVFIDNENNILMNFYLIKSSKTDQGNLVVPDKGNSSVNMSFKDQ